MKNDSYLPEVLGIHLGEPRAARGEACERQEHARLGARAGGIVAVVVVGLQLPDKGSLWHSGKCCHEV